MTRAIRISLGLATASKLGRLAALLREMRSAGNFYVKSLWQNDGKLDAATLNRFDGGSLGYRQKSEMLKFALETVISTKRSAKTTARRVRCPLLRGAVRLSSLTCKVETGKDSFDFILKVSGLSCGNPIVIPFKSHARLNYWLAKPGAKLKHGACVKEDAAWLFVEVPDGKPKPAGRDVGLDVGFNKLIADSDGHFHGEDFKMVCSIVRRKKPGSNGKRRAQNRRRDHINKVCKNLPWKTTKNFVLEDLTGLKVGKGNRGKRNRKLLAPWSYRQVRTRLEQLAPENRVRLVFINPKGTSRTCPACGLESVKNRVGEKFDCLRCHYTADADFVGAVNILDKTTRNCPEPMVPVVICGS